jgi:hypothetical protein
MSVSTIDTHWSRPAWVLGLDRIVPRGDLGVDGSVDQLLVALHPVLGERHVLLLGLHGVRELAELRLELLVGEEGLVI